MKNFLTSLATLLIVTLSQPICSQALVMSGDEVFQTDNANDENKKQQAVIDLKLSKECRTPKLLLPPPSYGNNKKKSADHQNSQIENKNSADDEKQIKKTIDYDEPETSGFFNRGLQWIYLLISLLI